MNLAQALKMALKSIFSNKGRSVLTMLGVIIGLAAVMVLVTYAKGQNIALNAFYESMGTNVLSVYAYDWSGGSDVGKSLYDYCLQLDGVAGVSPNGNVWSDMTIKHETKTLSRDRSGGNSFAVMGGGSISMGGSEDEYPQIYLGNDKFGLCNGYTIAKGRDISYMEVEKLAQVCVLGSATAEYLFSFSDPVGKTVTFNGMPFRVVGVYQSKGNVDLGKTDEDNQWMADSIKRMDRMILLPSTMTRYFNNNQPIDQYTVKLTSSDVTKDVVTNLNTFLSGVINQNNGSFGVYPQDTGKQDEDKKNEMQQKFSGGIAAISLLVAGIGIMNIMLVTVTERTREIGIRKAIGAERKSIIAQFLIEAAMICGIGGILGVGMGYLATVIICKMSFGLVLLPSAGLTFGAFAISVVLGIIFGLYPAIKASGLQPVEALRAD